MSVSLYMAGRYMPDGYTLLHEDAAAEADDTEADDADEQEEGTTETLIDNENNN